MSTYTVRPFDVVVSAARLAASSIERSGAPLQLRVICEKSLCSMGLMIKISNLFLNGIKIEVNLHHHSVFESPGCGHMHSKKDLAFGFPEGFF